MAEQKEKKVEDIKKEAEGRKCPVSRALYYIEQFLDGPMCGKCFPCEMGVYEAGIRLKELTEGRGTEAGILAIGRIASDMRESSRCKKGKDTAKFLLEWLGTDVFKEHVEGRCPDRECLSLIEHRIMPGSCIVCGLCQDACKHNAIIGERKIGYKSGYLPFEIRRKRCTECGDCVALCPTSAIIVVDVKSKEPVGV